MDKIYSVIALPAITASLYAVGYCYAYGYYAFFDISLSELDFSIQDIAVYSVPALAYAISLDILLFLLASFFVVGISKFLILTSEPLFNIRLLKMFVALFSFISLVYLLFVSAEVGKKRAEVAVSTLNPISFGSLSRSEISPMLNQRNSIIYHLVTTRNVVFCVVKIGERREKWTIRIPREGLITRVYSD